MKTKIGVVIDRSATSGGGRPSLGSFLDAAAFNKRHAVVVAICGFTFMFETMDWSALPLVGAPAGRSWLTFAARPCAGTHTSKRNFAFVSCSHPVPVTKKL